MIDPRNLIDYRRTPAQLEELLLFLIMAAGHRAEIERIKLHWFLDDPQRRPDESPLAYVWRLECTDSPTVARESALMERIRHWRIAPYGSRYNAFWMLAMRVVGGPSNQPPELDLRTCTREDLCRIHGISMKTASLFLLDSRPKVRMAALDTHILAELRERTGYHGAPQQTPASPAAYTFWEGKWLDYCDLHGLDYAQADLNTWVRRSDAAASRYRRTLAA